MSEIIWEGIYNYINFEPWKLAVLEEKISFGGGNWRSIIIELLDWDNIVMNLDDFTYMFNKQLLSFSPFHISFDMIFDKLSISWVSKIVIPLYLKEKFEEAIKIERCNEIQKLRETTRNTSLEYLLIE